MFFSLFSQINQLSELLDSPHLDVRMAAGETIALAYELGREHNEDFQRANTPQLADKLRQLATDSHKYRAKKDRKQQRSSFRDILHYVEVSVPVNYFIHVGGYNVGTSNDLNLQFLKRNNLHLSCTITL